MIDSGKINNKNQLAKKLVEQRIAANMEDAMEKMSAHDEIMEDDMSLIANEEELEKPENKTVVEEMDKKSASRLIELENKVNKLNETIDKIQSILNNNFREIDQRLNELKSMRAETPRPVKQQSEEIEKKPASNKPKNNKCDPDNYSQDDVSVENIFSNAHGRLNKK